MLAWCICIANREGRGDIITGFEIQLDGGNVDFAKLHLGVTYGAHKISNLEDLWKNERNHSEDTVTTTIDPSCEGARTRVFSNLRVTNISLSS